MTTKTNNKATTFELDPDALPSAQRDAIEAFLAANPNAMVRPIREVLGEGAKPAHLTKASGKRWTICSYYNKAIKASAFLMQAASEHPKLGKLGGGVEDLRGGLVGSYSNRTGVPCITLSAS